MLTNSGKVSILIATPCFGGLIDANTAGAIYALGLFLQEKNIKSGLYFVQNESYVPSARNRIAQEFLATSFTHIMCIDADIGFTPEDVWKLIEMNKEFSAGAYPTKTENKRSTVKLSKDGEVLGVGAGFVLLKKSVFEKILPATQILKAPSSWGTKEYHDFYSPIIENEVLLAEDYSFCKRWKDLGGEIHVNNQISLTHYGKYGYK